MPDNVLIGQLNVTNVIEIVTEINIKRDRMK